MENCKNRTVPHRREDEEDDVDGNTEIFVALMKNFTNKLHQLQQNHGNKRKRSSSASAGGWVPAFQLEDFTTDIQFKKHVPAALPRPCNNIGNVEITRGSLRPNSPSSPNLKLGL